ncbi:hypothetical protein STENM36S_02716 [Streptomyces tendae]
MPFRTGHVGLGGQADEEQRDRGQQGQPGQQQHAGARGEGVGERVGVQGRRRARARLVRGTQHQEGDGGRQQGPAARHQRAAQRGRVRRAAEDDEGGGADEQGGGEVGEVAGELVEGRGQRVLGGAGVHGCGRLRRLADGEGEGARDRVAVGGHHPPGHGVRALPQLARQRDPGRVGTSVRVPGRPGADAVTARVQDAEGVVAQADGLAEGQGDVTGGPLEDGSVPGVGGAERGVGGRRSRAAEEEQSQHGAQQHQPPDSPAGPGGPAGPGSPALAAGLAGLGVPAVPEAGVLVVPAVPAVLSVPVVPGDSVAPAVPAGPAGLRVPAVPEVLPVPVAPVDPVDATGPADPVDPGSVSVLSARGVPPRPALASPSSPASSVCTVTTAHVVSPSSGPTASGIRTDAEAVALSGSPRGSSPGRACRHPAVHHQVVAGHPGRQPRGEEHARVAHVLRAPEPSRRRRPPPPPYALRPGLGESRTVDEAG